MAKKTETFTRYDTADYLESEEDIAAYLSACAKEDDPALFLAALGDIARARNITQLAAQTARRAENLFAEGVISAQRRDEAVAARAATAAQSEAARQQYLKAVAGPRSEEKTIADAQVAAARAGLDGTASLLAETRLTSPSAGEIAERFSNPGELVLIGVPVFTVVDPASIPK